MSGIFNKIIDFLYNPATALIILLVFITVFFLVKGLVEGFENNFTSFGPTNKKDGTPTTFMGIALTSWSRVSIVYIIVFIATLLKSYYSIVISRTFNPFINSFTKSYIPFKPIITYLVIALDPLIQTLLYIISFYATATLQIQYIIPQLLATYISGLPFTIKLLKMKTFVK